MEDLSETSGLMKHEEKSTFSYSKLEEVMVESTTNTVDSEMRGPGSSHTVMRNVGTSDVFPQGTSRESTNQIMARRSFDVSFNELDLCLDDKRSLSDSELEKSSCDLLDISSEFLDLPSRISIRSHPNHRVRLDPEKLYLDLQKIKLNQSRKLTSTTGKFACSAPKIEFTSVDMDLNAGVSETEDSKQSEVYIDNDIESNYDPDYVKQSSTHLWINLNAPAHSLLSPRSSNGSICSYRSSNADSAIEVLTPDEDMSSEHSPVDLSHARLWDDKTKCKTELSCETWNLDSGANLKSNVSRSVYSDSTLSEDVCANSNKNALEPIPSKECILKYSQTSSQNLVSSSQHNKGSSSNVEPLSHPIDSNNDTNLPSQEESNKGREFSLPSPPSVVVSDHSHDKPPPLLNTLKTLSLAQTSKSQGEFLDDPSACFHRSLSNSSISSTESFISIQSDSSVDVDDQTEFPVKVVRKQSSWKKIRNIVHWSPFIQQFKRRRYPWIQLAGHQGNFQAGAPGAILKKFDKKEHSSFNKLMNDVLRPYVPEYRGEMEKDGTCYIQQQDLLCDFEAPCVMDIKMGCRTYLEEELSKAREKPTLRGDMYKKMMEVDPNAPTEEEHAQKAITKPRYMQWRDDMSSSTEMGFRIEGIRKSDGAQVKNFKTTKDKASVKNCLKQYVAENPEIINKYLRRLKAIRATQEVSPFFKSHEIIGSSLLFVHDKCGNASIWMIDFGKTVPLPESVHVTHRNQWIEGNHEDGYLMGIDSLITIFEELDAEFSESSDISDVPCVTSKSEVEKTNEVADKTDIKDDDVSDSQHVEVQSDNNFDAEIHDKNNESVV